MLGLKPVDPLFPIGLARSPVTQLKSRPRFSQWLAGDWDRRIRDAFLAAHEQASTAVADTTSQQSASFLPPLPQQLIKAAHDTTGPGQGILGGQIGNYADIGMMIRGHGEMGGSWNRYSPCDPGLQLTCQNSLVPQLRPDVQFGVLVGGTVSDRVHVNVDYDQTREFDAANNINVYYQGMPDEVLQKVEMGDVSIRLPASRYITQGIPAGNFGFKATGQLGPIDFQTVFAQQRGDVTTREFRMGGTGNTTGLVQDESAYIDDADYVKGQFFFLTDPDSLTNSPNVDVVTLRSSDAPASLRPEQGEVIAVYRDERPSTTNLQQQAQLGYFLANAVMPDGSRTHSGQFRRLQQGRDYVLHSSGLWIMLKSPLRSDEALAVSYVTETGDTVGTLNAEAVRTGGTPTLRLIRGPAAIHQPNYVTWKYEMHNVYRVHSSSSVDLNTIQLQISFGQASAGRTFATTPAGQMPYLKLFGLDEDAPANAVDVAQIYQPSQDLTGTLSSSSSGGAATAPITGTYVIFPTLRPFYEPGPVPSAGLSADAVKAVLGTDANGTIYNDLDPVARDGAARYRLNLQYRVQVDGLVSSFNLGAFGIREGSDRITIGDKVLTRGTDYNIDYDIGAVTLLDAQSLFATNPGAEIHATWEQKSQFQIAPTSVFGMNARYALGARGELNFIGMYQAQKTIMSRPQLGVEPGSIFLGGTSGHFDLGGGLIDRALSKVPGLRLGGVSALSINGEAAMSMPNPNTRGQAYVEDFESADAISISPLRRNWFLGSRPEDLRGGTGYFPDALLPENAAQIVWQHDPLATNGQPGGTVLPSDIDKQIKVSGTEVPEPVMWLTLGDQNHPIHGKRWRSITTVLSTTGTDMTRSEYLELYVNTGQGTGKALIVDIGTVSEDAFYVDSLGRTQGVLEDGTNWGLGTLDAEARLAQREIWGPEADARGLWGETCKGTGANAGALGDPSVNCARSNGYLDTEDLDGNGLLDGQDGDYFRYVIPLDKLSPYLVRDYGPTGTGTNYALYRVPLREGTPIGNASSTTWRFIKHLRLTFTSATEPQTGAPAVDQMRIARMRIVGSKWVKRDLEGVSLGLLSDQQGTSAGTATIEVGPVGSLTDGAMYQPPPRVIDQLQDPTQGLGAGGIEYNEKGLRIRYTGLAADERAEIYYRYAQQPRSFLNYRSMHVWALPKSGNFGPSGNQKLLIKVGTDERNYYLYQAKLTPPIGDRAANTADWQPEVVIDFQQWFSLKAKAELGLLKGTLTPPAPGEPYVVYSADSTYAMVFEDRARAPNLAAVRELSFAVYNGSSHNDNGEVWLDDIRLGDTFRDGGIAGNVSINLQGGDFLSSNITVAHQGAMFRQLSQEANYLGTGDLSLNTTAQLGQLLPASWGLEMPISISHSRSSQDPTLLEASDVQAAELPGLRISGASTTRIAVSMRKRTPSSNPIVSALLDGTSLRLGYNTGTASAITTRNVASGLDGALNYSREVKLRDVDIIPRFIETALRALAPAGIENSGFFKRLTTSRLRYTPTRLIFSTSYFGQEQRSYQYNTILQTDSDAFVVPFESPRRTLDSDAGFTLQPFSSLTADLILHSSRDLLPSDRASTRALERNAIESAHRSIAGVDMGWETGRTLNSTLNYKPIIADWLQPLLSLTTRFGTDRSPSYLELVTSGADTTAILQRRFQADRQLRKQLEVQPYAFFRALLHDTTGIVGRVGRVLKSVQPINLAWNDALGSQFDRNTSDPTMAYQLALGDLQSFRIAGIDSATAATETGRFDANTSLHLLKSATVDMAYANSNLEVFDQLGGGRFETEKTWPDVRLNWNDVPMPAFIKTWVPVLNLSGSYQLRRRNQKLGGELNGARGGEDTNIPFTARLMLRGGLSASYTGTWTSGTSKDPTGDAQAGGMNHNVNLTAVVKPPQSLADKLKQPLRFTLALTQTAQHQCRFQTGSADETDNTCVSFIDFRNRTVNFTLDTNVSDLVVGMQVGYNARQDFVGTRTGNSQLQIAIFANFELPVGQLPQGMGPGGPGSSGIR